MDEAVRQEALRLPYYWGDISRDQVSIGWFTCCLLILIVYNQPMIWDYPHMMKCNVIDQ